MYATLLLVMILPSGRGHTFYSVYCKIKMLYYTHEGVVGGIRWIPKYLQRGSAICPYPDCYVWLDRTRRYHILVGMCLSTQGEFRESEVTDHESLTATAATTRIICLEHQARAGKKLQMHPNAHPMSAQFLYSANPKCTPYYPCYPRRSVFLL